MPVAPPPPPQVSEKVEQELVWSEDFTYKGNVYVALLDVTHSSHHQVGALSPIHSIHAIRHSNINHAKFAGDCEAKYLNDRFQGKPFMELASKLIPAKLVLFDDEPIPHTVARRLKFGRKPSQT